MNACDAQSLVCDVPDLATAGSVLIDGSSWSGHTSVTVETVLAPKEVVVLIISIVAPLVVIRKTQTREVIEGVLTQERAHEKSYSKHVRRTLEVCQSGRKVR